VAESLPRCLLAWTVACGVAFMSGVLLMLADLWERAGDARLLEEAANTAEDFVTVDDIIADYEASLDINKERGDEQQGS
jgi:hypothetical protein